MSLKRIMFIVVASFSLLSACSEQAQETPSQNPIKSEQSVEQQKPDMRAVRKGPPLHLSEAPFLRVNMPDQAMAYLRLPNLFGLTEAEGTIYDPAHQSEAYKTVMLSIRQGMIDNLISTLTTEPGYQLLAELVIENMRSPVEVAMIAPADPSIPMPSLLGTVKLDIDRPEALNGIISRLVLATPVVKIAQAVDASGNGMLAVNGLPVQLYFDVSQQRLFFISGVMAPANHLQMLVSGLKPTPVHLMHASEVKIDNSGQGLYGWIAPKSIIKTAQSMGQAWGMFLAAGGLSEADGIAFGAGVAGGKQRLRIEIQMPHVGLRRFLPTVDNKLDFKAAGELDNLLAFSIPGADDVLAIEQILAGMLPPESMAKYSAAKQELEKRLGVTTQELLSAVGPELLIVMDEAGQYSALKLKNRELFQKVLSRLVSTLDLKLEERSINGRLYHHLVIPSLLTEDSEAALTEKEGTKPHPLLKHLLSLPSHAYWLEDDDYLVFAGVPQILIDRGYITARTPVDEWLMKEQKVDAHASWLLASTQMEGLPQFIYSLELQGLLSLADIAGAEVDMFSLPTHRELGLPANSGYSAKLDSTDKLLSLELSYENNPAEVLMAGNGVTGVAVIGILAAVAIPAYQDYTIRAKITQGVAVSVDYRNAIVGYYGKYDKLPTQEEMANLIGQPATEQIKAVHYDEETGRLTIVYAIPALGEKNRLFLTPGLQEGQIVWTCSADILHKYLPSNCRD